MRSSIGAVVDGHENGEQAGAMLGSGWGSLRGMNAGANGLRAITKPKFSPLKTVAEAEHAEQVAKQSIFERYFDINNYESLASTSLFTLSSSFNPWMVPKQLLSVGTSIFSPSSYTSTFSMMPFFGTAGAQAEEEKPECRDPEIDGNDVQVDIFCNVEMAAWPDLDTDVTENIFLNHRQWIIVLAGDKCIAVNIPAPLIDVNEKPIDHRDDIDPEDCYPDSRPRMKDDLKDYWDYCHNGRSGILYDPNGNEDKIKSGVKAIEAARLRGHDTAPNYFFNQGVESNIFTEGTQQTGTFTLPDGTVVTGHRYEIDENRFNVSKGRSVFFKQPCMLPGDPLSNDPGDAEFAKESGQPKPGRFERYADYIGYLIDEANLIEEVDEKYGGSGVAGSSGALTNPCAPGTTDLNVHDGYSDGLPIRIRLCALPNLPSSSAESNAGSEYYVPGADGKAIVGTNVSEHFYKLVEAAKAAGIPMSATSTFRTMKHQEELCEADTRCKNGDHTAVAAAGHSNHQSGQAIDFAMPTIENKRENCVFTADKKCTAPGDPVWEWLNANSKTFFIEQYYGEFWHFSPDGR
jgi:hypothetical protein